MNAAIDEDNEFQKISTHGDGGEDSHKIRNKNLKKHSTKQIFVILHQTKCILVIDDVLNAKT